MRTGSLRVTICAKLGAQHELLAAFGLHLLNKMVSRPVPYSNREMKVNFRIIALTGLLTTLVGCSSFTRPPPVDRLFDGYVELLARVSSTSLIHLERNRYSVPTEHANSVVSLRIYHDHMAAVADGVRVAAHQRCFDHSQTLYDWQHYISLLECKRGAAAQRRPVCNHAGGVQATASDSYAQIWR